MEHFYVLVEPALTVPGSGRCSSLQIPLDVFSVSILVESSNCVFIPVKEAATVVEIRPNTRQVRYVVTEANVGVRCSPIDDRLSLDGSS